MANIRALKQSVAKVADTAKKLQGTLKTYEDKNKQQREVAQRALNETSTGADGAVAAALDEAGRAIADAAAKLADAEKRAREYAARL